jgi:hypothetical protein
MKAAKRMRATVAGLAMAAALLPTGGWAADWHLNGSLTEEFTFDDNFRLNATNEQSLWGFNTRPHMGLETHSPQTDLYVNGSLNYGYFPDRTSENSFDQHGDVSLKHRSERTVLAIGGNVSRATTRTTEDEDTGRNYSDAQRIGLGGNASMSYALTERTAGGLQGGGNYVTYDTNALNDYRTFSAGPFVTYQVTEKDSVRLNGIYTRYDRLSGLDYQSDLFVANAEWTHVFHPQWKVSLRGGGNYISSDQEVSSGVTTSQDKAGYDAGATLTYTEERASISGSVDHSVVPSGTGRLERRNSLNLNASYNATPLITFGFGTSFIQQDAAEANQEDRNFVRAEPSVSWHFLPDWSARVAYRFRTQTLNEGERAYSNGGLASVTWHLPGWGATQGK